MNIKCVILFILTLVGQLNLNAQVFSEDELREIDSLSAVVHDNSTADTSKASALVALSEMYIVSNPDTIVSLCENAIEIAEKNLNTNLSKDEQRSFRLSLANAYNNKGYVLEKRGLYEDAIKLYDKSLILHQENEDKANIAIALNNIGIVHYRRGHTDTAIVFYEKSLTLKLEVGDTLGASKSLNNIGTIYYRQGDISRALEYYHKCLEIKEQIGNKEALGPTYTNLGSVYRSQKDYKKALEYFEKGLTLRIEVSDRIGEAYTYTNIGDIYGLLGDKDKSVIYFEKGLEIHREEKNLAGQSHSLHNLGEAFSDKNEIEQAKRYYKESLSISESTGNKNGLASTSRELGRLMLQENRLKEAKVFALQSLEVSNSMGYPELIRNASGLLSKIASAEGDYKTAFKMYKLHVLMRDSIYNKETERTAARQQSKYEYEKILTQDSIVNAEEQKVLNAEVKLQKIEAEKEKEGKKYLYIGLAFLALFGVFIFNRLRVSRKQNKIIEQQKSIVDKSNAELTEQKNRIHIQKEQIEEKNKEVMDSIVYAKRLQQAILPSKEDMNTELKDGFVLFQPKDVVSGDFYWMYSKGNGVVYFAAADCTGHGVPGAMVSVVCSNALDRAVKEYDLIETGEILDKVTDLVIERFDKSGENVKDGMDIALCAIDFEKNTLQYSGANNPLWILKEKAENEVVEAREVANETHILKEYKATKQPVGNFPLREKFATLNVPINKGDVVYVFTDGFADQFGGIRGKKFKYKPFKKLILDNQNASMESQKEVIQNAFSAWKGDLEQIDDVCIIGVRI